MNDVNPFDSFAARLRIAQLRKPARKRSDTPTEVDGGRDGAAETLGVRLRFKRKGAPRGGEPYEVLSQTQQKSGTLDADGCLRLRVPLSDPEMVISVGTARRLRVALTLREEDLKSAPLARKPRIQP